MLKARDRPVELTEHNMYQFAPIFPKGTQSGVYLRYYQHRERVLTGTVCEFRDVHETFWAEIETRRCNGPRPETRPTVPRPRHIAPRPRRDRDETLVRLETVSRPRRLGRDHIPGIHHSQDASMNKPEFQLLW